MIPIPAGLAKRLLPLLGYAALAIAVLAALWWLRADAYRDGVKASDAAWIAASKKLEDKARFSAAGADRASGERMADHAEQVRQEKERIDEAQNGGSSPLDVLFGA